MPVAAVMGGTALAGAAISSSASKSAAKTQAGAADRSADLQLQMFQQMRGDLEPYRNFGSTALPGLSKLLGIDQGGGFTTSGLGGSGGAGSAASGPDWNAYITNNPDVQQWIAAGGGVPGNPNASAAEKAAYHYQNSGQSEGRALPQFTGGGAQTLGSGGDLDWDQYLQQYPDVLREYNSLTPEQRAGAGVATPQEFARRHYQLYGQNQNENRQVSTVNPIQRQLESLPGYQFARDQGIKSIGNALGSKGLTGAQSKGIARFVTGLADQTYGEQVNRLQNAATMGQNASAQTGSAGVQTGQNVGQAYQGAGQAIASGQVGSANAISSGLYGLGNAYLTSKILGGSAPNIGSGGDGGYRLYGLGG